MLWEALQAREAVAVNCISSCFSSMKKARKPIEKNYFPLLIHEPFISRGG